MPTKTIYVSKPDNLIWKAAKHWAKANNISLSKMIIDALAYYMLVKNDR